ncbi:MAG: putative periplasmic protein [Labilithrix sp.]|nr:putative periplasmic protein [Labilithrix sp.]
MRARVRSTRGIVAPRSPASPPAPARHPLAGKTTTAIGVMLALLAVPYAAPGLARFRVVRAPWDHSPSDQEVASGAPAATSAPQLTQGETTLKASKNEATVTNALPEAPVAKALDAQALAKTKGSLAVEDDPGHALDAFYASLARTRAKEKGAVTRIMHYGDSVITSDYVSGTMRRKLQAEYGDAGHGFILLANPWEWYFHNDVSHGAGEGWNASRITGPTTRDGMYGLGGVTFSGTGGATAFFGTPDKGTYGKKVSRFDVYYLETASGGEVETKIGTQVDRFSTKGEDKVSRIKSFSVPDGEAKLSVRVVSGSPRLFGVALERDQPGIVYDALGANGARAELLGSINAAHWGEQMALRKPALIILQYGTNESEAPGIAANYEKTLGAVVATLKTAAPNSSILIASPLDRAEPAEGGGLRTKPIIKKLVEAQRHVAKESGVAFWNTYEAMGGEGAMASWVKKGLAGGDLTHPSPAGAEVIGDLMSKALTTGFEAWQSTHP